MKNPRRLYRQLSPHELRIRIKYVEAHAVAGCKHTARKVETITQVFMEMTGVLP